MHGRTTIKKNITCGKELIFWEIHRIAFVVVCCTHLLKEVAGYLRIGVVFKNVVRTCVTYQCEFRISKKVVLKILLQFLLLGHVKGEM
jgi:hypothetical protein